MVSEVEKSIKVLSERYRGRLRLSNCYDYDNQGNKIPFLEFAGACCPICGRDHYCMINAKGTRVICTKVPNDGKRRLNGWVYEINGEKPIAFNEKVAAKQRPKTNQQAPAQTIDMLYRIVLSMRPLSAKHRQDLLDRGLSAERIDNYAGHPGFGSFLTDSTYWKKKQYHDMQLGFNKAENDEVVFKSRWNYLFQHLNLAEDSWKGVPGFYLKESQIRTYNKQGEKVVSKGAAPYFGNKTEGLMVPYYNEKNQMVGFQVRVDHIGTQVKVLRYPDKKYWVEIEADGDTNEYTVRVSGPGFDPEEGTVIEQGHFNDGEEITVNFEMGLQKVTFEIKKGGKYFWISSANKKEGASWTTPVQVAYNPKITQLEADDPVLKRYIEKPKAVWLTEGGLKALVAADNLAKNFSEEELNVYGRDVLAVAGVSSYRKFFDKLKALHVSSVTTAYDMDFKNNPQVKENYKSLIRELLKQGYKVRIAYWSKEKGLDDALVNKSEFRFKDIK
ncbi:DUF3854 domain-containing protein [Limosilactobacillus mucosae]|uniref:DUF3854 domain-containing protein n=1 Tax=Limosilactobacillus mucosae TaxID=97478 RepID=A0AAJ1MAJ4_LIMMU|nr:DUF3854 domain-containing protein [Limosilactobacillus mucosae]MDC2829094.1 DUF3854 domain-containing protein [Limosilactobacillus mucosae]